MAAEFIDWIWLPGFLFLKWVRLKASVKEEFNIIIFGDCNYFYEKEKKSWHCSGFVGKVDGKDKENFSFTPIKQEYYSTWPTLTDALTKAFENMQNMDKMDIDQVVLMSLTRLSYYW